MPNKQRTFELVDVPKAIRPMTSKQAKKAYQKANRTPRISKAEQKRRDAEELAKHRKAYEKEQAAAKAKAARDKKAAKALEQKEERKRLGMPEPSRHVRASQSRISMFIKQGNKRPRDSRNTSEESEDTICDDLDEEPPAKRFARDNAEDEDQTPSKPTALNEFEDEREPQMKQHVNNNIDNDEKMKGESIVLADSEDEFGDFPPLSENDISFLDIGSMHSTPANANPDRLQSMGFHEPARFVNNDPQLPKMKNIEREQISPDEAFQLDGMVDAQILSEAADAASRPDIKQRSFFEKAKANYGHSGSTTFTPNDAVKDISGERELLWHAPIYGRHHASVEEIKFEKRLISPVAALKIPHIKQKDLNSLVGYQFDHPSNNNVNGSSKVGINLRSTSASSAPGIPLQDKLLKISPVKSNQNTVVHPDRVNSRISKFGKQVLQEVSLHSPASKFQYIKSESHKKIISQHQRNSIEKSSINASKSASGARSALRERSTNMGPPALPEKSKFGMPVAAPLDTRKAIDNFNLPPSSTRAFLETHLDSFPSPTQEARELREDSTISRPPASFKTGSATQNPNENLADVNSDDTTTAEDEFGIMLSTQELRMFSQDWETTNSPPYQEEAKENKDEGDSCSKIAVKSGGIENLICSDDSFLSSQDLAELEPVLDSKKSTRDNSPCKVDLNRSSTPTRQIGPIKALHTSSPQLDPEMELTPRPRSSPWFKEKPEDKYTQKRFFTEKPEDLEVAAIAESKKAWNEIKEATLSNRHNFDDDLEPGMDDTLKRALQESKEWDEVYKAIRPTPTPRKSIQKDEKGADPEKEIQTPSRILCGQAGEKCITNGSRTFKRAASVASTDYGDGEDPDWEGAMEGL